MQICSEAESCGYIPCSYLGECRQVEDQQAMVSCAHTHDAQAGEWCQQVIDQQAEMHDPTWFHGQGYAKVVTIYLVFAG